MQKWGRVRAERAGARPAWRTGKRRAERRVRGLSVTDEKSGAGGRNRTDTSLRKPDFASHYGFRHDAAIARRFVGWTLSSPWADAVRWLPLSLYTFPITRAWLGVGIVT